jgi:putative flavoprotein involved in K+ transport
VPGQVEAVPACIRDARALFFGSLRDVCALADLKMNRMLDTFDAWAQQHRVDGEVGPVERLSTTEIGASPRRGRCPRAPCACQAFAGAS